jgi:hypothetical protein
MQARLGCETDTFFFFFLANFSVASESDPNAGDNLRRAKARKKRSILILPFHFALLLSIINRLRSIFRRFLLFAQESDRNSRKQSCSHESHSEQASKKSENK